MTDHLANIIAEYDHGIPEDERDLAAHLLAHGIRAMLAELIEDRPDLLSHPRLETVLERMALAVLGEANPNRMYKASRSPREEGPY